MRNFVRRTAPEKMEFPPGGIPILSILYGGVRHQSDPHIPVYQNRDRIHVRGAGERMRELGLIPVGIDIFIAASTPSVLQSQTREQNFAMVAFMPA
jgi:hypothetical protein